MIDDSDVLDVKDLYLRTLEAARQVDGAKGIARLSREFGEEPALWAMGQWELRRKGTEKFEKAGEMFFTREGLEMATHEKIAEWHASFFPAEVEVVDLSCGIGADLIALARRGKAMGVDIDEEHVDYARWNLEVHDLEGKVTEGDSVEIGRASCRERV